MGYAKEKRTRSNGQASIEYLLGLSVTLAAMVGLGILFSDQVEGHLHSLARLIQLPF